ncbi:MAG: S8 family peptidase [Halioglobus sp.]|nr:S8 family peptidase [Halioglobus sp.]MDG2326715.1 S8 family peptidase [Halioglobus sp.]
MMKHWLLMTFFLLLASCGGGGSSGGSQQTEPPPVAAPPVDPPPAAPPVTEGFVITGTVIASSSQSVDGDTNDTGSEYNPNDTLLSAQAINNPTTLGGYVNQPGSGESGRSFAEGDVDDFFQLELLAGQSITMVIADFDIADADLYLYNQNGDIIDFSIESGEVENLIVPDDGTFLVNVSAYSGGTNYLLAIGNQANQARSSLQHYIEPWQAIVRYRDSDHSNQTAMAAADLAMEQRGGGPQRPWLMQLKTTDDRQYLARRMGTAMPKRASIGSGDLQARFETLMTIKRLRSTDEVELAEPNFRVRGFFTPDDEAFETQWHLPLIDLPAAWDSVRGDPDVTVAVVDTGILSQHPDLAGQWVAGYDFVRDIAKSGDGDGIDPNPEDPGNLQTPGPSSYHGTHVAGTVGAAGNNGIGVAGVAYGARIMPLRALGEGGVGTSYDVSQAIRYAAGLANDSGTVPDAPADVINLSLGGGPFSSAEQQLYNQVIANGTIVVAAAGNEASSVPQYPASYDGVFSVSAVDINRQLASYSSRGVYVDVAAPGGDNGTDVNGDGYPDGVLSTGGVDNGSLEFAYTFLNGTSMAAPHMAGVMALMRSVNPGLSPADIETLLVSGRLTDDLGPPGRDDSYGHGMINAYKSVIAALDSLGDTTVDLPRLSLSATTLSFGDSEAPLELELINAGSGELTIESITSSEQWLSVSSQDIDEEGLGSYDVNINRQDLADGVYSGDIKVLSSANLVIAKVFMSVGRPGGEANVGAVYILLYDRVNEEAVAEFSATAENGRYAFQFTDVPPGQYELVAGSDSDNDFFICDAGEACGSWLTLDQPIVLELNEDRAGLDFPVEYQVFLPDITAENQDVTSPARQRQPIVRKRALGPARATQR